jgi:hypothetical protein
MIEGIGVNLHMSNKVNIGSERLGPRTALVSATMNFRYGEVASMGFGGML